MGLLFGVHTTDAKSAAGDVALGNAPDFLGPATIGMAGLFVRVPTSKTNQVIIRGWTEGAILDVVNNPVMVRKNPNIVNRANGNPVTYYYRADGHYVVRDDVTGDLVQISDTNQSTWIDEMTNSPIQPIK